MAKQKLIKGQEVPFTQIANSVLYDKDLSLKAKGLFAYLYSKPENWEFSATNISRSSKDSIDGTEAGLRELEEKGYLKRQKLGTGKIKYLIFYDPSQSAENPDRENPNQGNSLTGKIPPISNIVNTSNIEKESNIEESTPGEIAKMFFDGGSGYRQKIYAEIVAGGLPPDLVRTEMKKFIGYWSERNSSGTKQRWQTEKTFEVKRRLNTWFNRIKGFETIKETKGIRI